MRNLKILGATALVSVALSAPASATVVNNPDACQAQFPNANCLNDGPGNPYKGGGRYVTNRYPVFGTYGFATDDRYAVPAYEPGF